MLPLLHLRTLIVLGGDVVASACTGPPLLLLLMLQLLLRLSFTAGVGDLVWQQLGRPLLPFGLVWLSIRCLRGTLHGI